MADTENHQYSEEAVAFGAELEALMQKYDNVRAIELLAVLSQFAGQAGGYATLQEGVSSSTVAKTINSNSLANYMAILSGDVQGNCGECPTCLANKRMVN